MGGSTSDSLVFFGRRRNFNSDQGWGWNDFAIVRQSEFSGAPVVTRSANAVVDNDCSVGKASVDPADPNGDLLVTACSDDDRYEGGYRVDPTDSNRNYAARVSASVRRREPSQWGSGCVSDGASLCVGVGEEKDCMPLPASGNATVSRSAFWAPQGQVLVHPEARLEVVIKNTGGRACEDFEVDSAFDLEPVDCSGLPRVAPTYAGNATRASRFITFDVTPKVDLIFFDLKLAHATTGYKTADVYYAPGMTSAAAGNLRVNYQYLYRCNKGIGSGDDPSLLRGCTRNHGVLLRAGVPYAFAIAASTDDEFLVVSPSATPALHTYDDANITLGLGRSRTSIFQYGLWQSGTVGFHGEFTYAVAGVADCTVEPPVQTCDTIDEESPVRLDIPLLGGALRENNDNKDQIYISLDIVPTAPVYVIPTDYGNPGSISSAFNTLRFVPQDWSIPQSISYTTGSNGDATSPRVAFALSISGSADERTNQTGVYLRTAGVLDDDMLDSFEPLPARNVTASSSRLAAPADNLGQVAATTVAVSDFDPGPAGRLFPVPCSGGAATNASLFELAAHQHSSLPDPPVVYRGTPDDDADPDAVAGAWHAKAALLTGVDAVTGACQWNAYLTHATVGDPIIVRDALLVPALVTGQSRYLVPDGAAVTGASAVEVNVTVHAVDPHCAANQTCAVLMRLAVVGGAPLGASPVTSLGRQRADVDWRARNATEIGEPGSPWHPLVSAPDAGKGIASYANRAEGNAPNNRTALRVYVALDATMAAPGCVLVNQSLGANGTGPWAMRPVHPGGGAGIASVDPLCTVTGLGRDAVPTAANSTWPSAHGWLARLSLPGAHSPTAEDGAGQQPSLAQWVAADGAFTRDWAAPLGVIDPRPVCNWTGDVGASIDWENTTLVGDPAVSPYDGTLGPSLGVPCAHAESAGTMHVTHLFAEPDAAWEHAALTGDARVGEYNIFSLREDATVNPAWTDPAFDAAEIYLLGRFVSLHSDGGGAGAAESGIAWNSVNSTGAGLNATAGAAGTHWQAFGARLSVRAERLADTGVGGGGGGGGTGTTSYPVYGGWDEDTSGLALVVPVWEWSTAHEAGGAEVRAADVGNRHVVAAVHFGGDGAVYADWHATDAARVVVTSFSLRDGTRGGVHQLPFTEDPFVGRDGLAMLADAEIAVVSASASVGAITHPRYCTGYPGLDDFNGTTSLVLHVRISHPTIAPEVMVLDDMWITGPGDETAGAVEATGLHVHTTVASSNTRAGALPGEPLDPHTAHISQLRVYSAVALEPLGAAAIDDQVPVSRLFYHSRALAGSSCNSLTDSPLAMAQGRTHDLEWKRSSGPRHHVWGQITMTPQNDSWISVSGNTGLGSTSTTTFPLKTVSVLDSTSPGVPNSTYIDMTPDGANKFRVVVNVLRHHIDLYPPLTATLVKPPTPLYEANTETGGWLAVPYNPPVTITYTFQGNGKHTWLPMSVSFGPSSPINVSVSLRGDNDHSGTNLYTLSQSEPSRYAILPTAKITYINPVLPLETCSVGGLPVTAVPAGTTIGPLTINLSAGPLFGALNATVATSPHDFSVVPDPLAVYAAGAVTASGLVLEFPEGSTASVGTFNVTLVRKGSQTIRVSSVSGQRSSYYACSMSPAQTITGTAQTVAVTHPGGGATSPIVTSPGAAYGTVVTVTLSAPAMENLTVTFSNSTEDGAGVTFVPSPTLVFPAGTGSGSVTASLTVISTRAGVTTLTVDPVSGPGAVYFDTPTVSIVVTSGPIVTAASPALLPSCGCMLVTITGSGFGSGPSDGVTTLSVASSPCESFTLVSSTQLVCKPRPTAFPTTGAASVAVAMGGPAAVASPGGIYTTTLPGVSVNPAPLISAVSPDPPTAAASGGGAVTSVTLYGSGFLGTTGGATGIAGNLPEVKLPGGVACAIASAATDVTDTSVTCTPASQSPWSLASSAPVLASATMWLSATSLVTQLPDACPSNATLLTSVCPVPPPPAPPAPHVGHVSRCAATSTEGSILLTVDGVTDNSAATGWAATYVEVYATPGGALLPGANGTGNVAGTLVSRTGPLPAPSSVTRPLNVEVPAAVALPGGPGVIHALLAVVVAEPLPGTPVGDVTVVSTAPPYAAADVVNCTAPPRAVVDRLVPSNPVAAGGEMLTVIGTGFAHPHNGLGAAAANGNGNVNLTDITVTVGGLTLSVVSITDGAVVCGPLPAYTSVAGSALDADLRNVPVEIRTAGGILAVSISATADPASTSTTTAAGTKVLSVTYQFPPGTYLGPQVTSASPARGTWLGGERITLSGKNLVAPTPTTAVVVGRYLSDPDAYPCVDVVVVPADGTVICTTTASNVTGSFPVFTGYGGTFYGPLGPLPVYSYEYPNPVVSDVRPRVLLPAGGETITVRGNYFGVSAAAGLPLTVTLGVSGAACNNVQWVSETELTCVAPASAVIDPAAGGASSVVGINANGLVVNPTLVDIAITVTLGSVSSPATRVAALSDTRGLRVVDKVCTPACAWTGTCDETQGVCARCIGGYTNAPACDVLRFEVVPLNGVAIGTAAGIGLGAGLTARTSEDGDTAVIVGRLNDVSPWLDDPSAPPLVVEATIDAPREGVWDITFNAGAGIVSETKFAFELSPTQREVQARIVGLRDESRDGNVTYPLTTRVVSGPAQLTDGSVPTPAVSVINDDSLPVILKVRPRTIPLIGVPVTITAVHIDDEIDIVIGGLLANRSLINMTRRVLGTRSGDRRVEGMQASGGPTNEVEIVFMSPPTQPPPGYRRLELSNLFARTNATMEDPGAYLSDDCPEEGQYGIGLDCKPCPKGGFCPGGNRVWPLAGYWNPGEESGFVQKCEPPEACLDGANGGGLCATGYEGDYCGACSEGFRRSATHCVPCPAESSIKIYMICDIIVWVSFGLAGCLIRDRMTFSYCVMLVRALQMLAGIGDMADSKFPQWAITAYEVLRVFSGDYSFLQPECSTGAVSWASHYYVSLVYHVAIFVPLFTFIALARVIMPWLRARDQRKAQLERDFYTDRFIRCLVIFPVCIYLVVTSMALETLSCEQVGDGSYRMITHREEICYKGSNLGPAILSGLTLCLLTVYFPLKMLKWLRLESNADRLHGDERFMERWNFLYEFYNPNFPTFWLIEFPITVVVAAGNSILRPHVNYQMSICVALFAFKLGYILFKRPFIDWMTDVIQAILALVSMIAINMTFLSRHGIIGENGIGMRTLVILVFGFAALSVVGLLVFIVYTALIDRSKLPDPPEELDVAALRPGESLSKFAQLTEEQIDAMRRDADLEAEVDAAAEPGKKLRAPSLGFSMEIDRKKLGLDSWDSDSDEVDEDVVLAGREGVVPIASGEVFEGGGLASVFGSFLDRIFPAPSATFGRVEPVAGEGDGDENMDSGSGSGGEFMSAAEQPADGSTGSLRDATAMQQLGMVSDRGGNDAGDDGDNEGGVADSDVDPIVE